MEVFLNKDNWEAVLPTKWAGKNLVCYDELVSTNMTAADLANENAVHGTLIVADKQTGGRGRRGRTWESPAGKNLYFSLLLRPEIVLGKTSMLTLVMAVSVVRAMEQSIGAGDAVEIKWPNDILIHGKKVCGILTELKIDRGQIAHVVVGVGINVKAQVFVGELAEKASSLEQECGQEISRENLLGNIMKAFEEDYEAFVREGSLKPFQEYYHSRLLNKDAQVKVLDPQESFEGIARGITENGELLVEREDGHLCTVYAGEVSVRSLLGYV